MAVSTRPLSGIGSAITTSKAEMRSEVDQQQAAVAGVVDVADLAASGSEVGQVRPRERPPMDGADSPGVTGWARAGRRPRRGGGDDRRHLADERLDLCGRGADERRGGSASTPASVARSRPRRASAASRSSRSLPSAPSRAGQRDRDGVLLDDLVRLLAPDARPHRGHQDLGGGEEREVALELALDHRRVGAEAVEHRQERLEQPSVARKASGSATRRTTEHDTSPSFHWSPASPATIVRWPRSDDGQAVDPLARAGVHLVGHGRAPDLAGGEPLGRQLVAGHQPDRRWPGSTGPPPPAPARPPRRSRASGGRPGRRWSSDRVEARGGAATAASSSVDRVGSPSSRSSWSCWVPTGPLMPAQRVAGEQLVDPAVGRPAAPRRRWRSACRASWPGRPRCGCARP